MNGNAFDAFTRQAAAAISRRTSLLTIGGAALTAVVAAPKLATAKKGNKAKKKCRKQEGKCREGVRAFCEDFSGQKDEEQCIEILSECCEFFKNCNAKQGTECLLREVFTVPPPM